MPSPVPNQPKGALVNKRLSKSVALTQALDLRDAMHARAMDAQEKSLVAASCVRAWKEAQDEIRVIRGKLKPGSRNESVSLKPDKPKRQRHEPPTPVELAQSMDSQPPALTQVP